MDSKDLHCAKAKAPISVRPSGITIDFNFEQPWKALVPIFVMLSGNFRYSKDVQLRNVFPGISLMPSGKLIAVSFLHSTNAFFPIVERLLGRMTDVREFAPSNAAYPNVIIPSDNTIDLRPVQF